MTATSRSHEIHQDAAGLRRALVDCDSIDADDGERITDLSNALADRERMCRNLEAALVSSRRIGAAIGIVMAVMKVTEDDAFAVISQISQATNRKLRLVADDIVLTGSF